MDLVGRQVRCWQILMVHRKIWGLWLSLKNEKNKTKHKSKPAMHFEQVRAVLVAVGVSGGTYVKYVSEGKTGVISALESKTLS